MSDLMAGQTGPAPPLAYNPAPAPGQDPAAPLTAPPPEPDLSNSPFQILTTLSDPAAAASNPNRFWQSATPSLPETNFSPEPSPEERRKVQRILELYGKAKEYRRPLFTRWRENYFYLINRASRRTGMRPQRPDWLPAPQIAEIFPIVATMAGWVTDQRPTATVAPASIPHDAYATFLGQMAEDLEFVLQSTWQANREERQINMAAWDLFTYGTAVTKTYWDPLGAGGLGDSTFVRVSPFNFYPDPNATDEYDGNYFLEVRRMTLQDLDRRYPGAYDLFKNGSNGGPQDIDEQPTHIDFSASARIGPTPAALSPSTSPNTSRPGSDRIDPDMDQNVTVIECWYRESEIVTVTDLRTGKERDGSTDEWKLAVVANNRLIFEAHAHDLWDHGQHPYNRWPMIDMGEFWSISMVEMMIDPMKAMNRILAALQMNAELTGNPILKRPRTNARTQFRNVPGQTVEFGPGQGQDLNWLEPPRLQQEMIGLLEYYAKALERISGMSAVVKGNTPSGRNAQGVVDAVQEAAFVRIRAIIRNLEWCLWGVFSKKADLIVSNYTSPRLMSIAGPRATRSSLALKANHFLIPTSSGRVPFVYQLNVDAGSSSHTSRAMREDRAVQLFTLGMIDEEAALADLDYPNYREVAARTAQKRAMQMLEAPGQRERARA